MKAVIRNKLTGETVSVSSSSEHPDCSYGQQVWVDDNGLSYFIVGMPNQFYDILSMDASDREGIGQMVHLLRVTKGISIRGLAEQVGMSKSTIVNIEQGAFSPRVEILTRILDALGAKLTISI